MRVIKLKDLDYGRKFAFKDSLKVVEEDSYLPIWRKILINIGKEIKEGILNDSKSIANVISDYDQELEVFEVS